MTSDKPTISLATYLTPANAAAILSDEPTKKLECITKRVEHLQIVSCQH